YLPRARPDTRREGRLLHDGARRQHLPWLVAHHRRRPTAVVGAHRRLRRSTGRANRYTAAVDDEDGTDGVRRQDANGDAFPVRFTGAHGTVAQDADGRRAEGGRGPDGRPPGRVGSESSSRDRGWFSR